MSIQLRAGRLATIATLVLLVLLFLSNSAHAQDRGLRRLGLNRRGTAGDCGSRYASLSRDGNFAAFTSCSKDLVDDPPANSFNVFLRDLRTNRTSIIQTSADGVIPDGGVFSDAPALSADGRFVAFSSDAINLAPYNSELPYALEGFGDDAPQLVFEDGGFFISPQVYVFDTTTQTYSRASQNTFGERATDFSIRLSDISGDGRFVLFDSSSSNLDPVTEDVSALPSDAEPGNLYLGNRFNGCYVHDRATGITTLASRTLSGKYHETYSHCCAISDDGRFVAYHSDSGDMAPTDNNGKPDVFLRDMLTSTTRRVSAAPGGADGDGDSPSLLYAGAYRPGGCDMTPDGSIVLFNSTSTNLTGEGGVVLQGKSRPYIFRAVSGTVTRVPNSTTSSDLPAISADGRKVLLSTLNNLDLIDLALGRKKSLGIATTFLSETDPSISQYGPNVGIGSQALSGNGQLLAFTSRSPYLLTGNVRTDVIGAPDTFVASVATCPTDPGKMAPGVCGCGRPEIDLNKDGVIDCGRPVATVTENTALSRPPFQEIGEDEIILQKFVNAQRAPKPGGGTRSARSKSFTPGYVIKATRPRLPIYLRYFYDVIATVRVENNPQPVVARYRIPPAQNHVRLEGPLAQALDIRYRIILTNKNRPVAATRYSPKLKINPPQKINVAPENVPR